jgi:hypothetical protein
MNTEPTLSDTMSMRHRIFLVCIAWIASLIITYPSPFGVFVLFLFPLGIIRFFSPWDTSSISQSALIFAWCAYAFVSGIVLVPKKKTLFYACYLFLIALLLFNIAGCRRVLHYASFHAG